MFCERSETRSTCTALGSEASNVGICALIWSTTASVLAPDWRLTSNSSICRSPYQAPAGCVLRDTSSQTRGKVCRIGTPASTRLIVLMGDSHAHMWLPPLLKMAWRDGWAVVPLVRLGCTPATWVTNERGCGDWYRWARAQALRLHATVTLLGGSTDEHPSAYTRKAMESLLDTARTLKAAGRVVVIGDPEGQSSDPVDCLLAPHATMASCTTTWQEGALAEYDEIAQRTKQRGVGFLPTR